MAWLRTLDTIQVDFSIPSITFHHHKTTMTLQGDLATQPLPTTFHQLKHLVHTNFVASLHLMIFQPNSTRENSKQTKPPKKLSPHIQREVSQLLLQYPIIFQSQQGLPP